MTAAAAPFLFVGAGPTVAMRISPVRRLAGLPSSEQLIPVPLKLHGTRRPMLMLVPPVILATGSGAIECVTLTLAGTGGFPAIEREKD